MKYFILLLFILGSVVSQSQSIQRSYPTASQNNQSIPNAWSGGLNSCQLSEIDLNLDGVKDLFVFERSGNPARDESRVDGDLLDEQKTKTRLLV